MQDMLRQLKQQDKPCDNKASYARYAKTAQTAG